MAGVYGVNRTAKTLRLDYYGLKKRLEQRGAAAVSVPEAEGTARFVELAPLTSAAPCECFLELENRSGAKMRIQLKSTGTPDLAAFSQTFWNHPS
jgi:Holliday junction resolvase